MKYIALNYPMLWLGGGMFYGMLAVLFIAFGVSGFLRKHPLRHVDHISFNNNSNIELAASAAAGVLNSQKKGKIQ
ncbi:MAG: hypothetical protein WCP73_00030 [Eubacteriales bacterium]